MTTYEARVWATITCAERDEFYAARELRPLATLTDLSGRFGDPEIFTEWGDGDVPMLRDWRWPSHGGGPDRRPCRHEAVQP